MVGDPQELDLENQGLACQGVIEVHHEFIGLDGQNRSGNGAMGGGEPEYLAHLDLMLPQHFLGKFPLEVIPQLAVGLIRAQGHLVFAVHFHIEDGIIKAGNDPAGAHLKLFNWKIILPPRSYERFLATFCLKAEFGEGQMSKG
jgi:hypothetical protein